jgi:hypothetical protein
MAKKLIQAYRNKAYGPPLVNQKYAPLDRFDWSDTETEFCAGLLTNRWRMLNNAGLLPQPLTLLMPNWKAATDSEAGKNPPLVVVSTNRSKWINKAFEVVKGNAFANPSDLNALTDYGDKKISPPIYCPARIGSAAPRNVYIVVNISEYKTYKTRLAGTGVTIVGWSFRTPRASNVRLGGFGASRFAAIEFCKTLRTRARNPWDYAWLFDDNVVALTTFPGYAAVETAMAEADPPRVCAGFKGGTQAEAFPALRNWARRELAAGRGKETTALDESEDVGLLQQTVLWNIAYLTEHHLNFGPIFLESGEDVSMGHYFSYEEIPYFYYSGIGIRKEETTADNTRGSQSIRNARSDLAEWMAREEAVNPTPPPAPKTQPPPIKIKPMVDTDDDKVTDRSVRTVASFVVDTVLPNASAATQALAGNAGTQNTAKCQAVEQTICKAMEVGWVVDDNALNRTFKINGTTGQEVVPVDMP